jgi:hypothetical protein
MKKLLLIITLTILLTMMLSCLSASEPPESGIFEGIPKIEIISPLSGAKLTEYPLFKWKTSRKEGDGLFPIEVLIIFKEPIIVKGNQISNKSKEEDAEYMWDTNLSEGIAGEVRFTDCKQVVAEEIGNDKFRLKYVYTDPDSNIIPPDPIDPELTDRSIRYWVVISYSKDGVILRASAEHEFTYYQNHIPIDPLN